MRVLIVEDETAAYENLVDILGEVSYDIQIAGNTESVTQTIHWLQSNPAPDLIFMDIHLSDGSAFTIFDKMELETPIIFTTAYDRYVIEAFKVNSIDYLLKPVKVEDVKQALDKYKKLTRQDVIHYLSKLIGVVDTKTEGAASFMVGTTEYAVPLGNMIDVEAEIARMEAELKHKEGFLQGVMKKLSNEKFVNNAPAAVLELERKKQADAESIINSLKESIAALKK